MKKALSYVGLVVLCFFVALAIIFGAQECDDDYPKKPTPAQQRQNQIEYERKQAELDKALAIQKEIKRQVKIQMDIHVKVYHQ